MNERQDRSQPKAITVLILNVEEKIRYCLILAIYMHWPVTSLEVLEGQRLLNAQSTHTGANNNVNVADYTDYSSFYGDGSTTGGYDYSYDIY